MDPQMLAAAMRSGQMPPQSPPGVAPAPVGGPPPPGVPPSPGGGNSSPLPPLMPPEQAQMVLSQMGITMTAIPMVLAAIASITAQMGAPQPPPMGPQGGPPAGGPPPMGP